MNYTQCDLEYGVCQLQPEVADAFGHDVDGHRAVNRVARNLVSRDTQYALPSREEFKALVIALTDDEIDAMYRVGPVLAARIRQARDKMKEGQ